MTRDSEEASSTETRRLFAATTEQPVEATPLRQTHNPEIVLSQIVESGYDNDSTNAAESAADHDPSPRWTATPLAVSSRLKERKRVRSGRRMGRANREPPPARHLRMRQPTKWPRSLWPSAVSSTYVSR